MANIAAESSEATMPEDFSERFLRTLAFSGNDGVFAVDSRQRIVFWSETAEHLTQRPSRTVLGRHCFEVLQGEDCQGRLYCRQRCPTFTAARRGWSIPAYDLRIRQADGDVVNVNVGTIPLASADRTTIVHVFREVGRYSNSGSEGPAPVATAGRMPVPGVPHKRSRKLSRRESEVLRLMAAGLGTLEIAERLVLAESTVRNHIGRLFTSLGARSRLEAVVIARRLGILE